MSETKHRVGTREEWEAERAELAKVEAEQSQRNEEVVKKRRDLPWVPVEKEYRLDTEDGKKSLAELFNGRSQLLAYNIMFGPDYRIGACPGCTSLADGLDGTLVHLSHSDVTLVCMSRAPIGRLAAYKRRMGWQFPYVSTYESDFAFDFGLAVTEEQARQTPELKGLIDDPPESLRDWADNIGAELKDGLRENPSWIAFRSRTAPSTTPTRCRHPTPSSLPISASCWSGRQKVGRRGPTFAGRTSTRTDAMNESRGEPPVCGAGDAGSKADPGCVTGRARSSA